MVPSGCTLPCAHSAARRRKETLARARIAARLRLSKRSIIIELKIGNYLYFCRFLVILAFKGRLCALNLLNVMNTFGANLLNVMNTRETMMPLIFVVKLYKKGCSVITILKTFCIQKIKKTPCFMLMRRGVLVFRADPEVNTDAGRQSTRCFRSWCRW